MRHRFKHSHALLCIVRDSTPFNTNKLVLIRVISRHLAEGPGEGMLREDSPFWEEPKTEIGSFYEVPRLTHELMR